MCAKIEWMGRRLALALVLAAAACSSKSKLDGIGHKKDAGLPLSPSRPPADIAIPIMEDPVVDLPRQESFTLLDPGKGTRAELRYQLTAGAVTYHAETRLTSRHLAKGTWSD